jgi:hypothetical protein
LSDRALSVQEWGRFRGGAEQIPLLEQIPLGSFGGAFAMSALEILETPWW